jgi:hypothetical protein
MGFLARPEWQAFAHSDGLGSPSYLIISLWSSSKFWPIRNKGPRRLGEAEKA